LLSGRGGVNPGGGIYKLRGKGEKKGRERGTWSKKGFRGWKEGNARMCPKSRLEKEFSDQRGKGETGAEKKQTVIVWGGKGRQKSNIWLGRRKKKPLYPRKMQQRKKGGGGSLEERGESAPKIPWRGGGEQFHRRGGRRGPRDPQNTFPRVRRRGEVAHEGERKKKGNMSQKKLC